MPIHKTHNCFTAWKWIAAAAAAAATATALTHSSNEFLSKRRMKEIFIRTHKHCESQMHITYGRKHNSVETVFKHSHQWQRLTFLPMAIYTYMQERRSTTTRQRCTVILVFEKPVETSEYHQRAHAHNPDNRFPLKAANVEKFTQKILSEFSCHSLVHVELEFSCGMIHRVHVCVVCTTG